jgi:hypothetical protein
MRTPYILLTCAPPIIKSNCHNSELEILEMAQSSSDPNPINRVPIGNIVWGIVLNAVFR